MEFGELLKIQYDQQEKLIGHRPVERQGQRDIAKQLSSYLIGEVYEFLDAIGYKHFLPDSEAPRSKRLQEIVDILKYTLALAWTEGITSAELEDAFRSKTEVVEERWRTERLSKKVCAWDIDGILAKHSDYKSSWPEERKQQYWESHEATDLEVMDGAPETLQFFKDRGWTIMLITSRKIWKHGNLEAWTYRWLRQNNIPFDRVFYGADKGEIVASTGLPLRFMVEDSAKHALDLANNGITVYLLGHPEVQHEKVFHISSIEEVIEDWK